MPVERHFIEGSVHSLLAEASEDDSVRERELLQAAAEYESALREQPAHFWAATNLRQAYHRLGRLDEAAAFARLARLRPNDFSSLVLAADALLGAGGRDAASPYIARARALLDVLSSDTQYPEARKSYVLLFQAHDLWVDRRTKDATAFLDAVARRAEIAAEGDLAWGRLGSLYLSLGQLRRAEQTFARISDLQSRAFWTASVALARNDDRMVVARLGITHPSDLSVVSMLVRADELPVAERALRSIHVITPPHDIWAVQEIEEARGNQRVVSDALKAGLPWTRAMSPPGVRVFMYSETLARAASATGDIAAAIRVLEETGMLGEKTYTRASHTGYFWMRTQLLLADLYRQASRTDAARAIERDLLAALAAADTDYPIVIELKKRVSR
jgi:tetratricopeptide (TPR) repeat protein